MKNLDIEKLNRTMPYHLDENFFQEMQNNVVRSAIKTKETPIFKLNWAYAAAAALALLFGINFLFLNKNTEAPQNNRIAKVESQANEDIAQTSKIIATNVATPPERKQTLEKTDDDLTFVADNNPIDKKASTDNVSVMKAGQNSDAISAEQLDAILDGFSSSDLASLGNNNEQDVYLDLYN